MAALPYIQLYVADYLADTAHLTAQQHGAYLLLIFNYWQRGQALNNSNERLANVAHLTSEEWTANKPILQEFFQIDGDTWSHHRIEADLAAVRDKSTKASEAGKKSANKRATNVKRTFNHTDTDTDTDTNSVVVVNTLPKKQTKLQGLISAGVPEQAAIDWIEIRKAKRAPITKTALQAIANEAALAGLSFAEAITYCAQNNWQGFKAEWFNKPPPTNSKSDARAAVMDHIFPEVNHGTRGQIIDIEPTGSIAGNGKDFPKISDGIRGAGSS